MGEGSVFLGIKKVGGFRGRLRGVNSGVSLSLWVGREDGVW